MNNGTPKDIHEAIETAIVDGLSCPGIKIQGLVKAVYDAVKDRLAQDVQTAELKGETPKQLFDRMFDEVDDGAGPLY